MLHRYTILTAAHCVDKFETNNLKVIAGVVDKTDSSAQKIQVDKAYSHPYYGFTNG